MWQQLTEKLRFRSGTITADLIVLTVCHRVGHERWQKVAFMVLQTALIGSLASVGVDDRAQAIATTLVLAMVITPPQLLSFAMISIGIEHQVDIGVANGLASTFRLMGGAVATAIYSAILANRFAGTLPSKMIPVIQSYNIPQAQAEALLAAAAVNTAEAYEKVPNISPAIIAGCRRAVQFAYVEGLDSCTWWRSLLEHWQSPQRSLHRRFRRIKRLHDE